MSRQTYRGEIQWIVSDDGEIPAECRLGQTHILQPPASDFSASFQGNLLRGLEKVQGDKVVFIEDDDWYSADYLQIMSEWLDRGDLAGEGNARYYNVATKRYRTCGNRDHASLCQTGIRADYVPALIARVRSHNTTFFDLRIWKNWFVGRGKILRAESRISCGMKGLPGKAGIGIGHRIDNRFPADDTGEILEHWIGPEDAAIYREMFG